MHSKPHGLLWLFTNECPPCGTLAECGGVLQLTVLSMYVGLLTFLVFLYIEVMRSSLVVSHFPNRIAYESHRTTTFRSGAGQNGWDLVVAFLFIGDLVRFYVFLTRRTNATDVLNDFSIGNISSIFWTAIAASYLAYILLIGRCRVELFLRGPYFSIFVLILVYLLSAAWSVVPMFSLYRALELVVWVCLSVYFFTRLNSLDQKVTFLAIYCLTWIFSNIPLLIDGLSHKIIFSAIKDNFLPTVGFGVAVLGWSTSLRPLFCIIGIVTIVLAGSAASIASGLAACSVGMIFSRKMVLKIAGCVCLIASLFFIVVYLIAPDQFPETVDFLSNILQKPKQELLGATGRYTIWSILWDTAKNNYFGTGFGSDRFVQLIRDIDELTYRLGTADIFIMSAHNATLSAWFAAGWLGVVALFFVFLNGIRYSVKSDTNQRAATTMILVFIILDNLSIPGLGANYSCIWLVWIAVLSIVDRRGLNDTDQRRTAFNSSLTTTRRRRAIVPPR